MKTERLTLLTTPEFKAFVGAEAARSGISVAEFVRSRCERRPDDDEQLLTALTEELRKSVREAQTTLAEGLSEAQAVLRELRGRRELAAAAAGPSATPPARRRRAITATRA